MAELDKSGILHAAAGFMEDSPENYVRKDVALRPDLAGMRMFETPLMAVAVAGDPLFAQLQNLEAVGPLFMPPGSWLPGAQSVISFFLPFTGAVIAANQNQPKEVPPEWLHGRFEGQNALNAMTVRIQSLLEEAGYAALIPSMDKRFRSGQKDTPGTTAYTSTWSERHVAFVCGLGTFGLSRGLITRHGMAGRFGSIITDMALEPDTRPYSRYDEYCTYCGECAGRCPVHAIDAQSGKDMAACAAFQQETREKHAPRYGCGKCSVGVPCTSGIPG